MSLTMRTGLVVGAVFVAVGLAVAAAFLPLLIALGVLVGLCVLCFGDDEPRRDSTRFGHARERLAVVVAGAVVAAGYAAIGMITLFGVGGAVLVGVSALAVFGLRRLQRDPAQPDASSAEGTPSENLPATQDGASARRANTGSPGTGARLLLPADPAAMSIDDLCRAWRVSFLLLQKAHGPDDLEHAARLRRRYLDELARRDPEGFRRWLDDGARAAGDPSKYVTDRSGRFERTEDEAD